MDRKRRGTTVAAFLFSIPEFLEIGRRSKNSLQTGYSGIIKILKENDKEKNKIFY